MQNGRVGNYTRLILIAKTIFQNRVLDYESIPSERKFPGLSRAEELVEPGGEANSPCTSKGAQVFSGGQNARS